MVLPREAGCTDRSKSRWKPNPTSQTKRKRPNERNNPPTQIYTNELKTNPHLHLRLTPYIGVRCIGALNRRHPYFMASKPCVINPLLPIGKFPPRRVSPAPELSPSLFGRSR